MKHAIQKNIFQKAKLAIPPTDRLTHIPLKNQSLIALRETSIENETQNLFHDNLSHLPLPRLYSIISQNKKIYFSDNLSTPQRIFINFESFKWTEMYFNFFRQVLSKETNQFVFSDLLFQLDSKLAQYKTAVGKINFLISQSIEENLCFNPVERWRAQTNLISWILDTDSTPELFPIFIFDLILSAIDKENFSQSKGFFMRNESSLLLNHFVDKKLIQLTDEKIHIKNEYLCETLKDYRNHHGRFVIATEPSPTVNLALSSLKRSFSNVECMLQSNTFDSCFFHS